MAIMRGREKEPFKGNFYLYDEHWKPEEYHPATDGMPAYSVNQIKAMLSSGQLSCHAERSRRKASARHR